MNRIEQRTRHIKRVVSQAAKTHKAVQQLARDLFISERTVYRALVK